MPDHQSQKRSNAGDPFGLPGGGKPTDAERPLIPDHELIKPIGHGSYGEVWLARTRTGSYRAVKVVYRRTFEADKPYEREFTGIQAFEPISRSHPAQIDILHVGRNDEAGYFYYVMELADDESAEAEEEANDTVTARHSRKQRSADSHVRESRKASKPYADKAVRAPEGASRDTTKLGDSTAKKQQEAPPRTATGSSIGRVIHPETYEPETLRRVLRRRGRLPVKECLQIATSLAEALEHLHSHGLVHRDIKPSNVIFVNGRPKLADIGLVARTDATLSFVGTEGYLPPEGPGKPQADIYSLGKVLYEIATGRERNEFPQLPAGIEQAADHAAFLEFNEVILKACENSPDRRYQGAGDLVDDLKTLQAGKSVRWKNLISRTVKRSLKLAAALAVLALIAFLAVRAFRPVPPQAGDFSEPVTLSANPALAGIGVHYAWRRFDISPDNRRRILFADQDGRLFVFEDEKVHPILKNLAQEWAFSAPAWSGDSKSFAVSGYRRELLADKHEDQVPHRIFVGDAGTWKTTQLSAKFPGGISALLWKPDKTGLTVAAKTGMDEERSVFDVDLKDGALHPWPESKAIHLITPASSYSPNGNWICGSDLQDIWLIKDGGRSEPVRLTSDPHPDIHPTWANNETLYFVRYESPDLDQRAQLMRLKINPETGHWTGESDPLPFLRWSQILYPKVVDSGRQLLFIEREITNWINVCSYPGETNRRRLLRGDSPRLSPDSSEVYYIDRTPEAEGIYACSTEEGAKPRPVVHEDGIRNNGFDLAPDRPRLVYARPDPSGLPVIEVVATDGSRSEPLWHRPIKLPLARAFFPRWSPHGDLIAIFTGPRTVALLESSTGLTNREIELKGYVESIPALFWSPDGNHLAFILRNGILPQDASEKAQKQSYSVDVYSLTNDTWKRLAEADYIEYLSWRPESVEGELTYFGYGTNSYQSVFLSTDETKRLLPDRPEGQFADDFWGDWGPYGRSFYFCSGDRKAGQMHVFRPDPGPGRIEDDDVLDFLPFWSRDRSTMGWVNTEVGYKLMAIELR